MIMIILLIIMIVTTSDCFIFSQFLSSKPGSLMQFGEVKTAFMANKNTKLAGQPQQPWRYRVFYMAGCIEDLAEVVAAAL